MSSTPSRITESTARSSALRVIAKVTPIPAGGQGGQGSLEAGESGRGGASSDSGLEGLACELWTFGPATLTVETSMYPKATEALAAKEGKCIVAAEIVLTLPDGGR